MTELQQDVEDPKPAKVLGKRESKVGSIHSEAENGVEERKKVCRSPTALSPTLSVEAETQDQRRLVSQRVRRAAAISPAS
ncbi:GRAM domain-containing protein 2B-like isoform X2 [Echinops telfairi]|uniref:GRAM domain-containing protein 2B-like isoform X2 n=1 Tax=Echinops telfairi TaxID=9371 RepID=A0AC55CL31_ECHTE|nr:GRAM domain-containing protein 2B-like isoform X2 [Echinops telfairi]